MFNISNYIKIFHSLAYKGCLTFFLLLYFLGWLFRPINPNLLWFIPIIFIPYLVVCCIYLAQTLMKHFKKAMILFSAVAVIVYVVAAVETKQLIFFAMGFNPNLFPNTYLAVSIFSTIYAWLIILPSLAFILIIIAYFIDMFTTMVLLKRVDSIEYLVMGLFVPMFIMLMSVSFVGSVAKTPYKLN